MQDDSGDDKCHIANHREYEPHKPIDDLTFVELPQSWNDEAE